MAERSGSDTGILPLHATGQLRTRGAGQLLAIDQRYGDWDSGRMRSGDAPVEVLPEGDEPLESTGRKTHAGEWRG